MTYFIDGKMITPEIEKASCRVIAQKDELVGIDAEITSRKLEMDNISEDQKRLRENLKALKGSAEEKALVERYAKELNAQEDHVLMLQKETSDLRVKRDAAQKTLNEMIQGLEMQATI
jgi:hypothetical protein